MNGNEARPRRTFLDQTGNISEKSHVKSTLNRRAFMNNIMKHVRILVSCVCMYFLRTKVQVAYLFSIRSECHLQRVGCQLDGFTVGAGLQAVPQLHGVVPAGRGEPGAALRGTEGHARHGGLVPSEHLERDAVTMCVEDVCSVSEYTCI